MRKILLPVLSALAVLMLSGCATSEQDAAEANDPLESVNRVVFDFNQRIDKGAALPAATFYRSAVPGGVRFGVHNFLSNLNLPIAVANNVLQLHPGRAGEAAGRFVINSTIGVAGLFDVASDWGLPEQSEDFGQTMGYYGIGEGPYLVLPLIGPKPPRDFAGSYVDAFFSPLAYIHFKGRAYWGLARSALTTVDRRSANIDLLREIERSSVDYYATMRSLYRQRRNDAIRNGVDDAAAPFSF
jgi:phospholipid-binding lipoprotein MlaA